MTGSRLRRTMAGDLVRNFDLEGTTVPVGVSVIEASAGTGKTWAIAHLVPRLLLDGVVKNIGELLLVTYTEDAAGELGDRTRRQLATLVNCLDQGTRPLKDEPGIEQLLDRIASFSDEDRSAAELRLRLALEESDQLWVSTIHAFCKRVIATEPFLCGMSSGAELIPDDRELRLDAVKDAWRAVIAPDAVLSVSASTGKWSVEEDHRTWDVVTRRPGARFEPGSSSFRESREALVNAVAAVQKHRDGLFALKEIAEREGVRLNQSAKNPGKESVRSLDRWHGLLANTTPSEPTAELFEIVAKLSAAESWFRQNSKVGKAVAADVTGLPIVAAAKIFRRDIRRLKWAWTNYVCEVSQGRLDRTLRRNNLISFNGLIARLHSALCSDSTRGALARRLATRWRVGLIDESQDTDGRQLEIFRAVFEAEPDPGRLILVGDPKQAVYSFRGGDLDAYLSARPADDERIWQLAKTYRSAMGLVAALNALFTRDNTFGDARLEYAPAIAVREDEALPLPADGYGRFVAWLVADEDVEEWKTARRRRERAAACAATAIVQLLDQSRVESVQDVTPSQIAVLTRTNIEAEQVALALQVRGVPAVVRCDMDVMQSEMASDLIMILRSVLSPQNDGWRRAALSTRLFGYDAQQLLSMSDDETEQQLTLFSELEDLWRRRGVAALMAVIENSNGAMLRLAEMPKGERYLTDLRHLFELLHTEESNERLSPEMVLQWFDGQRMSDQVTPDERAYRLDKDGEAVQVVTVHKAKGLEFDFVFCPYLWSAMESRRTSKQVLVRRDDGWVLVDGDQQDTTADQLRVNSARLAEETRLAYVALTRARRRVTILAGPIGYGQKQSSLPPSGLDWLLRAESWVGPVDEWYAVRSEEKKKSVSACDHGDVLAGLCDENTAVFSICAPPVPSEAMWTGERRSRVELDARSAPELSLDAWQLSSFSALAHGRYEEQERRDVVPSAVLLNEVGTDETEHGTRVPLANFVRGARAGTCLHELLEQWDFSADPVTLVTRGLERHRLYSDESAQAVHRMLDDLATVRVESLQADLRRVAMDPTLSEWEFHLPLASTALTGSLLAETFARHARTEEEQRYAESLTSLPGHAVSGLLTGYIDRLVHIDQRWAVIDWKSNYLGAGRRDYSFASMWGCATSQHYVLQLHLYLVALRRYLRLFGEAATARSGCVVFLRGVQPGTSDGVLELNPPESLLIDLDALFQERKS
jgi:exodeoxyribonuclease V beta subunit